MRERGLEQVCNELLEEERVRDRCVRTGRLGQRCRDDAALHDAEQSRENHSLQVEAALVVRVRQDEQNVLQETEQVTEEELVGRLLLPVSKRVDELDGNCSRRQRVLYSSKSRAYCSALCLRHRASCA